MRLIRSEVARCRRILDSMATGAGESVAEPWVRVSVEELLRSGTSQLADEDRVDLTVDAES